MIFFVSAAGRGTPAQSGRNMLGFLTPLNFCACLPSVEEHAASGKLHGVDDLLGRVSAPSFHATLPLVAGVRHALNAFRSPAEHSSRRLDPETGRALLRVIDRSKAGVVSPIWPG